jgi:hypothetical protein
MVEATDAVKILGDAGLVEGDRRGKWVWYRIAALSDMGWSGVVGGHASGRTTPARTGRVAGTTASPLSLWPP